MQMKAPAACYTVACLIRSGVSCLRLSIVFFRLNPFQRSASQFQPFNQQTSFTESLSLR